MWRKEQKADVTKRQVCNKVPPAWQAKWFVKLVAPLRGGGGMRTGIFSHQEKKLVLCWICLGDGRQDEMKLLNNFLSSSTAQLSSTFCGCGSRVLGGQQQTSLAACLGCFLLLTQMCAKMTCGICFARSFSDSQQHKLHPCPSKLTCQ